jgi:general secretion pathway protein D
MKGLPFTLTLVTCLTIITLGSGLGCASHPNTPARHGATGAPSSDPSQPTIVDPNGSRATARLAAPTIIQGSGTLTAPPQTNENNTANSGANGFQLNFVDTEISAVVGAVLGDGLNLPYVVDPQVKGTITVQATRPLSKDEVLAALESALRVQGIALVDVKGVYHVVPAKEASRRITNLQAAGQGTHGYGIYIVPLQYVSAAEMEKILQPFAPDGGILRVDEARNLLLLAGTGQEINTLLNVVKTFDVDWLSGMSFGLYPLEYVDAKTLAGELAEVFSNAKSPIAGVVRLVPLTRLNALMIVTPQPKYLKEVEDWIKRLDLGSTTPGRRIYVYDVQNGKADDLAASLSHILSLSYDPAASGRQTNSPGSGSGQGGTSTYGTQRSGFGSGSQSSFGAGSSFSSFSSTPNALNTASTAGTSASSMGASTTGGALENAALKIVPNAENNSLLIFASPSEYAVIDAALKRLDVLPIQILIEASIAEVTLTNNLKYGLQWSYASKQGPITFSESPSGAISRQFPGFSFLYTGSASIQAVLNSIETLTEVRVISAPKLVVLNNREANLQVGNQVPIIVQSSVSTADSNAPIVNSIQMQDTGVILHVTPRANKNGNIILDVSQEVSDVVPTTTSNINSPTIEERRISSTVAVHDGETIALGGLISDSRSHTRDGIPFLRRIPLLGDLFGSTNKEGTRTELIVLLTPRVIRSDTESQEVMTELETQFRGLERDIPALIHQRIPDTELIPPHRVPSVSTVPPAPPAAAAPNQSVTTPPNPSQTPAPNPTSRNPAAISPPR